MLTGVGNSRVVDWVRFSRNFNWTRDIKKNTNFIPDLEGKCAHARAYQIFAETILNSKIISKKCKGFIDAVESDCDGESFLLIGETSELNGEGIYEFSTNEEAPFGRE